MLPLELRQEFRSAHMRGTAIELRNKQNSGWAQRGAVDLLKITYPTADVQRALEAVSTTGAGKPVVFKGNRGRNYCTDYPSRKRQLFVEATRANCSKV